MKECGRRDKLDWQRFRKAKYGYQYSQLHVQTDTQTGESLNEDACKSCTCALRVRAELELGECRGCLRQSARKFIVPLLGGCGAFSTCRGMRRLDEEQKLNRARQPTETIGVSRKMHGRIRVVTMHHGLSACPASRPARIGRG